MGLVMAVLRIFGITTVGLFALVGAVGLVKKSKAQKAHHLPENQEVAVEAIKETSIPAFAVEPITYDTVAIEKIVKEKELPKPQIEDTSYVEMDRVSRLFTTGPSQLPFVETISYKSRVAWLEGRPAWIADYASYYGTSRHFIARSLNGNRDYYTQKVSSGDVFNVFRKDKDIRFHLVVDLSQLKMWFYAYDVGENTRFLLKTYRVGCGKPDPTSASGCLTPLGTFTLGEKVAIYKPGIEGFFKDQKVQMIQIFGTRWLPYSGEQDESLAMIKGFGIHGTPWVVDEATGQVVEQRDTIGVYDSSGCIRLLQEDIEELFAIVITKPTTVQVVKHLADAKLPGVEWVEN